MCEKTPKFWILPEFISYMKYCLFLNHEDIVCLFSCTFPNTFYHKIKVKQISANYKYGFVPFSWRLIISLTIWLDGWDIDGMA